MTAPAGASDAHHLDGRSAAPAPLDEELAPAEQEHAHRLVDALTCLGLKTEAWTHGTNAMVVTAQCITVAPYAGRAVWLRRHPDQRQGLYWHWQRPLRNGRGLPIGVWFQPFCPADDTDQAATAISQRVILDITQRVPNTTAPADR